uniref:Uncharacterized protein n=1 Tax=Oryza meridionalis TaxID=40149 RepID=A0A0E0DKV7_9ORYZ
MPPSPGFSFGQIWRGDWRVVDRKGPGPALRDGGSLKSVDGGALVLCGGSPVVGRIGSWPAEGRRSSVAEAMCRRCLDGVTSPSGVVTPPEGTVEVPLLPRQGALDENLVQFLGRMTTASFGVTTLMRASF